MSGVVPWGGGGGIEEEAERYWLRRVAVLPVYVDATRVDSSWRTGDVPPKEEAPEEQAEESPAAEEEDDLYGGLGADLEPQEDVVVAPIQEPVMQALRQIDSMPRNKRRKPAPQEECARVCALLAKR